MAQDSTIGVNLEIDVADLKNGLTEANKLIGLSNDKFKAASSGMDDWQHSSEGLTAKLENLNEVQGLQKKKLAATTKAYQDIVAAEGETSEAAIRLRKQMYQQQTQVNKTNKEINKYEGALNDLEDEEKQGEKAAKKLGKAVKDSSDDAKEAKEGFTILKGAIAGFVVEAGKALVGGFSSMIAESRDFRKEMARVNVAMDDAGFSSEQTSKAFANLNGVIGDTGKTEEALQQLAGFATTEKEIEDYTNILTGVFGKWGNSLPTEGLAEAINHTIQLGEVQGPLADALEWVGITTDEFNQQLAECGTEQERNALISKTLNAEYGSAAKTYKEMNKTLIDAQTAETNNALAMAKMGEALEPLQTMITNLKTKGIELLTPAVQKLSEILQQFFSGDYSGAAENIGSAFNKIKDKITSFILDVGAKLPELIPQIFDKILALMTTNIERTTKLYPKIVTILTNIITSIIDYLPKLIDNVATALTNLLPKILEGALAMFQGILNALPKVISKLLTALPKVIDTITTFFKNNLPVILDAAIKLFNSIVDALPKVIESLVKALPKVITAIINFLTTNIPVILDAAIKLLMAIVQAIPKMITTLVKDLPKIITAIVTGIVNGAPQVLEAALKLFMSLVKAIPSIIIELVKNIPSIIKAIVTGLAEGVGDMFNVGKNLISGLWDGMKSMFSTVIDGVKNFGKTIIKGAKKVFGVHSPSKVFAEIGEYLDEGLAVGVNDNTKSVLKSVKNMASKAVSSANGILVGLDNQKLATSNPMVSSGGASSVVNNYYQTVNSPKPLSRIEIYRQTKNLIALKGGA